MTEFIQPFNSVIAFWKMINFNSLLPCTPPRVPLTLENVSIFDFKVQSLI